jgi:hypothetical protein
MVYKATIGRSTGRNDWLFNYCNQLDFLINWDALADESNIYLTMTSGIHESCAVIESITSI